MKLNLLKRAVGAGFVALLASGALAPAKATTVSPAGGALPGGVSVIGGVVFDAIGTNGTRLVSQLAASSLFVGDTTTSITVGTQTGFSPAVLSTLGGGISKLSVRISLFDGDSAPGDFDDGDNVLTVNGVQFGNFSSVATQQTSSTGTLISSGTGFGDNILSTGFFYSDDNSVLSSIFASLLSTNSAIFGLTKLDSDFQFYDFTQGIDASLIDVGTGPVVTPPTPGVVPLPAGAWLLLGGLGGLAALRRRKRA